MNVTVVRVYLSERAHKHEKIFRLLHDREVVRGVTMFRGISGFGHSGRIHGSSLLDLSLDLPVVIEFFDDPDKIEAVVADLREIVEPEHILTFPARLV
jgi:PII-like signaling protein